jgi:DNA-binding MarR family transcriptional regulator
MATLELEGEDCIVEVPVRLPLAEVERLMRILQRARRSGMIGLADASPSDLTSEQLLAFAKFLLGARRRRDCVFPDIEFGEPVWDMLLDLYVQHVDGQRVFVSSLCSAAAVPTTTALRWIDVMVGQGHFVRHRDSHDGRRVYISLAPALIEAMASYLTDMRRRALAALR